MEKKLYEVEKEICSICSKILGGIEVKISDNFILLGGSSIHIPELIYRIRKKYGILIPAKEIFDSSTISELCRVIERRRKSNSETLVETHSINKFEYDKIPLLDSQKQIWISDKLSNGGKNLKVIFTIDIKEWINLPRLKKAIEIILQNHLVYNVNFEIFNNEIVQSINNNIFEAEVHKIFFNDKSLKRKILEKVEDTFFDLENGNLYKVDIYVKSNNQITLLFQFHHIIFDQISVKLLWNSILKVYKSKVDAIQYDNSYFTSIFKCKENQQSLKLEKLKSEYLDEYSDLSKLVSIGHSKSKSNFEHTIKRIIDQQSINKTLNLKYTNSVIFSQIISEVLSKLFLNDKASYINLGIPYANRMPDEFNIQGNFVNIVPIKIDYISEIKTNDRFNRMVDILNKSYERQELSYIELLDLIDFPTREKRNNFIQVVFVYSKKIKLEGFRKRNRIEYTEYIQSPTDFPLIIYVEEDEFVINFTVDYDESLLETSLVEILLDDIKNEYQAINLS